jgi:NAD(P)H dehydrogenase (quinone)
MYAVAGVSGNTGRVVAETLLERGAPVRVVVRDADKGAEWAARGAEVALADLADEAALTAALRGASGFYTLIPPQLGAADPVAAGGAVGQGIARAAEAAGVAHVVLLSSVGAQHAKGTGPIAALHRAEAALRAGAPGLTALRASYFLENWGAVLQVAATDGVLPSFIALGTEVPTVSVVDIGRVGAELLLEGPRGDRVVELAGPTDPTPAQVAEALSALLGRPVQAVASPPAAAEPAFESFGMARPFAALYRELYEGIASGLVAWEHGPDRRGAVGVAEGLSRLL